MRTTVKHTFHTSVKNKHQSPKPMFLLWVDVTLFLPKGYVPTVCNHYPCGKPYKKKCNHTNSDTTLYS